MPLVLLFRDPKSGDLSVVKRWDGVNTKNDASNGNTASHDNDLDYIDGQYRLLSARDIAVFRSDASSLRRRQSTSNDEESAIRGLRVFASDTAEPRQLADSNTSNPSIAGNESSNSYFHARECGCNYSRNPIVYCPYATDTCIIPREEGELPICIGTKDANGNLVFPLQMLLIVWFSVVLICCLFPSGMGANLRDFAIQSCCCKKWNGYVADRITRYDPSRAENYIQMNSYELRIMEEADGRAHRTAVATSFHRNNTGVNEDRNDGHQGQHQELSHNDHVDGNGSNNRHNPTIMLGGGSTSSHLPLVNCKTQRRPTSLLLKTRVYRTDEEDRDDKAVDVDEEDDMDVGCAICFVNFLEGDRVGQLPCNHLFHATCLKTWLKRKNACPLCQQKEIATPQYDNDDDVHLSTTSATIGVSSSDASASEGIASGDAMIQRPLSD